jgi:hypothetical protein
MCAFFSRPNLDDVQFKQIDGSILSLSGQTRILSPTGLTLIGDGNINIPIIATGASNNYVLTYDDISDPSQPVIRLKESSGSGGTGSYGYTDLTTCSVGGLGVDQCLYGNSLESIIHCMVSPALNPTLSAPTASFSINPSTTVYEVGHVVNITGTTTFNQGCINPQYTSICDKRSNGTLSYVYSAFSFPYSCSYNNNSNTMPFSPIQLNGINSYTICSTVNYCAGVQPKNSTGGNYDNPLTAGNIINTRTICTILPWYWGKSVNKTITCSCVINGCSCKCLGNASGSIPICFNSTANDYLWFAIPSGTDNKTCWFVNGTNNGAISGLAGQTWALSCPITVSSLQGCWSNCTYNVYVTCLQTGTDPNVPMYFY